jgi:nucleotide-binding universal stress UspA family protein
MKTILVPTDGSEAAEKALNVALDLAEKHIADIKLLHVLLRDKEPHELLRLPEFVPDEVMVSELQALANGPKTMRTAEELMAAPNLPDRPAPVALLRSIGRNVLGRAHTLAGERGIHAEVLDIVDGAAAPAISAAAISEDVDMVVMGMRGLRAIEAVTIGSVSQDVCRSVACTFIAVH